jgi:hypothetical protein
MQQGGWRDGMQFLHERPNAALALGVSVIMLIMDLSPMSHAAGSRPLWLKLPPIALLVIGMSILIWLIRSFWEATFLGLLTVNIVLKGLLPHDSGRVAHVSPFNTATVPHLHVLPLDVKVGDHCTLDPKGCSSPRLTLRVTTLAA